MATVVSAYFRVPSKYLQEQYLYWIKNFLEHIPCHLVFFTDPDLVPLFTAWRGIYNDRTVFIPFNLDDAEAYKKYGRAFWEAQLEKDGEFDYRELFKKKINNPHLYASWEAELAKYNEIERAKLLTTKMHNPRLYVIWYEKKEFVLKAIALNAFHHEKFMWCDAGGFRITSWLNQLKNFPNSAKISDSKFFFLNIDPFTESELHNPFSDFSKVSRIGGGYLAGTASTWQQFSQKFDNMLNRYTEKGLFVGKDQNIMASIYIEDPESFDLIPTDKNCEDFWFYPQLYFS